jgi:uncharacterized protein YbbK (DUF523 family)
MRSAVTKLCGKLTSIERWEIMIIISACLVGENCKYNGGNNECHGVKELARMNLDKCILVCPEIELLSVPRAPVEIAGGRAVSKEGEDFTDKFLDGAAREWEKIKAIAKDTKIEQAILKSNSPSCGSGEIYDGTFSGKLVAGDGIFAKLLKENGIKVISEKEFCTPDDCTLSLEK